MRNGLINPVKFTPAHLTATAVSNKTHFVVLCFDICLKVIGCKCVRVCVHVHGNGGTFGPMFPYYCVVPTMYNYMGLMCDPE